MKSNRRCKTAQRKTAKSWLA